MKESLHKGHRARLRNRVMKESLDNFEDYQVLEYILTFVIPQKDTNPIAHRLINTFGSISNVLEADPKELCKVDGIGEITALFLNSYLGVYYHYNKDKSESNITIENTAECARYYRTLLKNKSVEEIYLTLLDSNHKVITTTKLHTGTDTNVNISPRDIIDRVVRHNASSIILCHNHPNGKPSPSSEDIKFTRDLVLSLMLNQVKILDHIIIGKDGYYSFNSSRLIDEYISEAKDILASRNKKTKGDK